MLFQGLGCDFITYSQVEYNESVIMLQKQSKALSSEKTNTASKVRVFYSSDFNFIQTELEIQKTDTVRSLIYKALKLISSKIFDIQIKEVCYQMYAAKRCGKKSDLPALLKEQTVGGTKLTHFYLQSIHSNTVCSTLYASNTCLFSEMRPQRPQKYQLKQVVSPLRKRYICC